MNEQYKIGDYEFHTYEEYLAAKEDVKKIDYITKEVDITDADVAVRLYSLIRNKEIVFHSKIGISFTWYLTDLLVQHSQNLLAEKRKKEQQEQQGKRLRIAGMVCIAAAAFCLGYYALTLWQEHLDSQEFERLQDMQNLTGHVIRDTFVDDGRGDKYLAKVEEELAKEDAAKENAEEQKQQKKKKKVNRADLEILKQYKTLFQQNNDLAGWLQIDGTQVNYPVMQTGGKDSEYYLHHDFDKNKSDRGSLFLDSRNDFVNRDTNLIIFGHNMRDGTMFGGLKNYMQKDYWEKHQNLTFDTIYEKAHYKIVAVCLSKVNYGDDYTFRYYNFFNAGSKEDMDAYVANIQQLTVFDQKIDISYGDELLTLSTCNNYTQDGRLFLVAKKE